MDDATLGQYTMTKDTIISFSFQGIKIWLIGTFDSRQGNIGVKIDKGTETTISVGGARRTNIELYVSNELNYGKHTLTIRDIGGGNNGMEFNGIYYLDSGGAGMFELSNSTLSILKSESQNITIERV